MVDYSNLLRRWYQMRFHKHKDYRNGVWNILCNIEFENTIFCKAAKQSLVSVSLICSHGNKVVFTVDGGYIEGFEQTNPYKFDTAGTGASGGDISLLISGDNNLAN